MGFTENDIRPAQFDEGKVKALHEDIEWLQGKLEEFVAVDCPACANNEAQGIYEKYKFNFNKCDSCGCVFMSPRPTAGILSEFFANSKLYEFWSKYIFPATSDVRREKMFRPRAERIAKLVKDLGVDTSCLVDVGAGYGTFLSELKALDVFDRLIAVEPNSALAANCRGQGLEVLECTVEQVDFDKIKPSIVTIYEVVATLFEPAAFIKACAQNMQPGALLVITCPNAEGFDMLELGKNSDSVDNENINLLNPTAVSRLLERSGFELVALETPGELDTDILKKKADSGIYNPPPFIAKLFGPEYDRVKGPFQEFLKANKLSSSMWVVARAR